MKFSETVGQHSVISKLVNSVDNGRISHAQLFFAKEGSGALPLALAYIQYIACPNKADGDSCGECNTCKKL
ncbi:MAG: DNA polymerase III subunit delta', partial [Flavobacteriales bacterium]